MRTAVGLMDGTTLMVIGGSNMIPQQTLYLDSLVTLIGKLLQWTRRSLIWMIPTQRPGMSDDMGCTCGIASRGTGHPSETAQEPTETA